MIEVVTEFFTHLYCESPFERMTDGCSFDVSRGGSVYFDSFGEFFIEEYVMAFICQRVCAIWV